MEIPASGCGPADGAVSQSGMGMNRNSRRDWKVDACHDCVAVSPITVAHHPSHTGARGTINKRRMSAWRNLEITSRSAIPAAPRPRHWPVARMSVKRRSILPRVPYTYVCKSRSSTHSAGWCHGSSSIGPRMGVSRSTR